MVISVPFLIWHYHNIILEGSGVVVLKTLKVDLEIPAFNRGLSIVAEKGKEIQL